MNNYNFDFNIDTNNMVKVSIMRLGLIFNSETIKALGSPAKINIGLDTKKKALGIKAADNNPNVRAYDFVKNGNEKWIRVNSKPLVEAIAKATGYEFTNTAISFIAYMDDDTNMLIVELSKK